MGKRKVCLVISNLNIGGAELSMYKIILELKNEIDFIVISLTPGGGLVEEIENKGISVYQLDINKRIFKSLAQLYSIIKGENPDVVHTWMYHSDLLGGILARLSGIKYIIWSIRNTDLIKGTSFGTRIVGFFNAFLSYFIPNKIIVVSNSAKQNHLNYKYCKSKMIAVPNGFSLPSVIYTKCDKKSIRAQLGFLDSTIIIGSVGRYNEYKDHKTFIASCLLLLNEIDHDLDITFVIIGKNVRNIHLFSLLEKSVHKNKFHFFDETTNIEKYYSIFDVFCLHSLSEGFPNVLAEAMYFGCVCISTDVGDARIILNDDSMIVPPKSPKSLAKKLKEVIFLNEKEKEIISKRNITRIDSNYSIKKMTQNYLNIYNLKNDN